jgi:hypothetical protein
MVEEQKNSVEYHISKAHWRAEPIVVSKMAEKWLDCCEMTKVPGNKRA